METDTEAESQDWLIAPETGFSRLAEDIAQAAVLKSDVFLEIKAEAKAALDAAFTNAEDIFAQYLTKLTDLNIPKNQFRDSLPREPERIGELYGRKGILASRAEKERRKSSENAFVEARRYLVNLKRIHEASYHKTISKIEMARKNAGIGVPILCEATRDKLKYLSGLERNQLTNVVNDNLRHIADIQAFHEAVRKRFGLAHKIFRQTQTYLTEEQLVHFDVLKTHEKVIRQAESLVRSIALLGDYEQPTELKREQEWDHSR